MKSLQRFLGILALALLIAAPSTVLADSKTRSSLVRTEDAIDPEAKGRIELKSKLKRDKSRERFKVKVETSAGLLTHDLYIEDGAGVPTFVAALQLDDDDDEGETESELEYKAELRDGNGALPLGAMDLAELVGRAVEIRVGADTVMTGSVPEIVSRKERKGRDKAKAKRELDGTGDAPAEAEAKIKVESRPYDGDERIKIEVEDVVLAAGEELHVYLEDPADPGVLVDLGPMLPEDDDEEGEEKNELEWERRTKHGDALPFDVASVTDLTDLEFEIREESTGDVWFEGVVPMAMNKEEGTKREAEVDLVPSDLAPEGSEAELEIKTRSDNGEDGLEVEVEDLVPAMDQVFHLFMEDPENPGTFADLGALSAELDDDGDDDGDDEGEVELEFELRTKDGDALPFGVTSVSQLAGLGVEIRDGATGDVYFSGVVPELP